MTQIVSTTGFVPDTWSETSAPLLGDYSQGPGVTLEPDDDPSDLAAHFNNLRLVVVTFGSSADGRGFSQAAQLRALGYTGHVRASGHVLVDQLRAAQRSGIDDIEISEDQAARNPSYQWQAVPLNDGYLPRIFAR